jgi:hypothetical protein
VFLGLNALASLVSAFVRVSQQLISGARVELVADLACVVAAPLAIWMLRELDRAVDGQA